MFSSISENIPFSLIEYDKNTAINNMEQNGKKRYHFLHFCAFFLSSTWLPCSALRFRATPYVSVTREALDIWDIIHIQVWNPFFFFFQNMSYISWLEVENIVLKKIFAYLWSIFSIIYPVIWLKVERRFD